MLFAILYKLAYFVFYIFLNIFLSCLLWVSLFTILFGVFGALYQTKIKRMLAYSSIGHTGHLGLCLYVAYGDYLKSFIFIFLFMFYCHYVYLQYY